MRPPPTDSLGSLRQGKTLADFLGTLAPLQQLSAPKRVSAFFFLFFFFLLLLAPAQGTDPSKC